MDKYSRQIGAFGMEAMSKLIQLKVSRVQKDAARSLYPLEVLFLITASNRIEPTRPDPKQVLIVGLKGVGIETAKNLILAGPGAVTLSDDHPTEVRAFWDPEGRRGPPH